jgi:hypothetical protein
MKFSNYESVQHRDDRLKKCARIAAAILGLTEDQLGVLIEHMHDHKGQLLVQWNHQPTERGMLALKDAWFECAEYITEHSWPGCPRGEFQLSTR